MGILTPLQTCQLIRRVKPAVPDLPLEFHGHNDLGMATANTIAAFEAGAECASVTVNGLGERAGNAPLAEVVMALKVALKCDCGFRHHDLAGLSALVADLSGRPLPEEKPVVGSAVFRHESGIHCGGLLKDPRTYEPFQPEETGHAPSQLVMGRHSGTRVLRQKLEALKLIVPDERLADLLAEIRQLAAQQKNHLTDEELKILVIKFQKQHGLSDL